MGAEFLRDAAMTAAVLGFFASAWFGWAQDDPPRSWRRPLVAGSVHWASRWLEGSWRGATGARERCSTPIPAPPSGSWSAWRSHLRGSARRYWP
jgi:hypothetical protein